MAEQKLTLIVQAKNMLARGLASAGASLKSFGQSALRIGKAVAVALGVVGAAAIAVGRKMVEAYHVDAAAAGKLEGVLKATGYAAGVTVTEMKKYASELQKTTGVGDETTLSMMGILASFKGIDNPNTFKRATAALLDMGAALGKAGKGSADVEAAAIQVGKALNNPIAGMSVLSRVGIVFTEQQKEQITALQKSGDLMGAQAIILKELEGEFGGTAKSVADAQHGILQMSAAFGDAQEEIGRVIVESTGFDDIIARITASLERLVSDGYIELWAQNARDAIEFIKPAFEWIGKAAKTAGDFIASSAAALGALSAGASFKEAGEAAAAIPKQIKEEKALALAKIQGKKAAEEYLKGVAEAHEAAAAKTQAAINAPIIAAAKEARDLANLEARLAEVAERDKWDKLIKAKEDAAKKKLDLVQESADLEVKIEEEKIRQIEESNKARFEAEKDEAEKALAAAQNLANKRVDDVINEAKARKEVEKGFADDDKKKARLESFLKNAGANLSKRDQEWLDAKNKIDAAKGKIPGLKTQLEVAEDNLAEITKQTTLLTSLETELKEIKTSQAKLLAMG